LDRLHNDMKTAKLDLDGS